MFFKEYFAINPQFSQLHTTVQTDELGLGLSKCENLQTLSLQLRVNNISEQGSQGLVSGLAQCSNLQTLTLDLRGNEIHEISAQVLGSGLAKCSSLQTLSHILMNQIDEKGAYGLTSGLVKLGMRLTKQVLQDLDLVQRNALNSKF